MYSWSLSHASGMDSSEDCWKLEIFPLRALVLLMGKNLARNAAEHLFQVFIASLFWQNHCYAFPVREKGNRRSLMLSCATSLMSIVSHNSRKC